MSRKAGRSAASLANFGLSIIEVVKLLGSNKNGSSDELPFLFFGSSQRNCRLSPSLPFRA
ncbi:hypothetical protein FuraDRAFT_1050 [Pseudogulbenkiania ferrooxidans 2002]|uniref:Uncharacterized protein n=1 Tax=Pseudogulbenkiania ferrooxidans 2002 TaxID=279714 RepID=B9Z115_9NEIS|nr:hypothetical protein FuraDRAFT_1050 [Pseudogulbenkiania ferrooxidans 2002]